MDISQISVAGHNIPAEVAQLIWDTARNSNWGRSFDYDGEFVQALNFRLDYLMNDLHFSTNRVVQNTPILVSPAGSNQDYIEHYNTQIERLEQNFGLGVSSVTKCPILLVLNAYAGANVPGSVSQKITFLQEQCGISHSQIAKYPQLFQYSIEDNGTPNCLPYKMRYLAKELGFGKQQLRKFPQILMLDCSDNSTNPANIKNKIKALQQMAGIGLKQLRSCPNLLGLDCDPNSDSPSAVVNKIVNLQEGFGFDPVAWQISPEILLSDCDPNSTTPTSIAGKMRFLSKELGFTSAQINSYPKIFGMDCSEESTNPAAIINKVRFYESMGIDKSAFLKFTNILGYDCDPNSTSPSAVISKLRVFDELKLDRSLLVQMPIILGVPANKTKIRYMLYNISPMSHLGVRSVMFVQNEAKTYARLMHIRNIDYTESAGAIVFSESDFQRVFGKSSADLINKYPLDKTAVRKVEQEYYDTVGQELKLNKDELDAVCKKE